MIVFMFVILDAVDTLDFRSQEAIVFAFSASYSIGGSTICAYVSLAILGPYSGLSGLSVGDTRPKLEWVEWWGNRVYQIPICHVLALFQEI